MQRLGMILLVIGASVLIAYGAYEIVKALFTEEIHLVVSIAVVVIAAGLLLLVVGIGYERWRAHGKEDLDEVEP